MKNNYYRIASGAIGATLFFICGGEKILNVNNIMWFGSGDAAQHWLGWNFFRSTPLFQWPLGLNQPYGMDVSSSIVFTDSIPLLAIFFKIISFALPDEFQYTGIWLLTCCVLQGVTAYELIYRNTKDSAYSVFSSAIFCLTPIMIFRMMGHFALSAHFMILASFILYGMNQPNKRWIALISISSAIHFYITGMLLAVFVTYLGKSIIKKEIKIKSALYLFSLTMIALTFTMYALGYFVIADGADGSGYGLYNMNVNAFYNPMYPWVSSIINPLPHQKLDYEGFAYLGFGVTATILIGSFYIITYKKLRKDIIVGLASCLLLLMFSISNNIFIGDIKVFSLHLPDGIYKILNIFRSSGRFVWVVIYATLAFFIVIIYSNKKRVLCISIIGVSSLVQYYDIHGMFSKVRERYAENVDMSRGLNNPSNDNLIKDKRKIEVVMPIDFYFDWPSIGYIASKNKLSMNFGYMARFSMKAKTQQQKSILFMLYNGIYDPDSLYLFKDRWTLDMAMNTIKQKHRIEMLGDYYALTVTKEILNKSKSTNKDDFYQAFYSHYN
ncbi:hypothetical protein CI789_02840 [Erwinia persicina]|uniref:DUF6311 domain-containing protein n=1 Tax=Erwinia persicina TaxID=55211 RepID=UPI000E48A082|nr:DUF6311 domain-containing protein [Erwinia persicina]AXU94257.1 hypothetical protein CI789_02840 [Erwinia persicina]